MDSVIEALVEQMSFRLDDDSSWFVPLEKALKGVTAPVAAWRPSDEFNSIWQIVNHLTFWTQFVSERLLGSPPTGKRIDNQMTFGDPGDPLDEGGWQDSVTRLRSVYRDFRDHLEGASLEDINRVVNSAGASATTMISGCLMHDSYHIGQIVLLRRLQDDWNGQQ